MTDVLRQQQVFEELIESQSWSVDQIVAYQHGQIEILSRHAASSTVFYGERLAALVSSVRGINWDQWRNVPTVRRSDLVEFRIVMHARHLPPGHVPISTSRSSGSTGVPVTVTTTALAKMYNNAARWRAHQLFDFDWRLNLCSRQEVDPTKSRWPEGTRLGTWGPQWLPASTGTAWRIYKGTPSDKTFEFLLDHDCRYLNVGAKTAHALALEAERLGAHVQWDGILAQGEGCDDADRETCRRAFGARILEHYSSKEMGQAAHPCELGTLHVNEENVFIEILDEQGNPCPPGVSGRVVVTPLHSMAQPLIRYEQGDIARFGGRCTCGRSSRTIEKIEGRTATIFRHPDGRVVSRLFPGRARDALNCAMLQVAQVGPTNFEIRYVPRSPQAQPDRGLVCQIFRQEYFEDAQLQLVRVNQIRPTKSGKIVEHVNEYWQA